MRPPTTVYVATILLEPGEGNGLHLSGLRVFRSKAKASRWAYQQVRDIAGVGRIHRRDYTGDVRVLGYFGEPRVIGRHGETTETIAFADVYARTVI